MYILLYSCKGRHIYWITSLLQISKDLLLSHAQAHCFHPLRGRKTTSAFSFRPPSLLKDLEKGMGIAMEL